MQDTTAAAVTLSGSSRRLTTELCNLSVSDVDPNWTRCFFDSEKSDDTCLIGIRDAEASVAEALTTWVPYHENDLQHSDQNIKNSVKKVGPITFIMFRNIPDKNIDYEVGSTIDVTLELREIRRSTSSDGYTLIWRSCGYRVHSVSEDSVVQTETPDEKVDAKVSVPNEETVGSDNTKVNEGVVDDAGAEDESVAEEKEDSVEEEAHAKEEETVAFEVGNAAHEPHSERKSELICHAEKLKAELDTLVSKIAAMV